MSSFIFRSDAPQVGERVVVRRRFGEVFSDVVGHVVSIDPLVVRPQEVGGYPSDLEAVEIPQEQVHIIKRLSPRTVRNSDIRAIEWATAEAFPGKEHAWTADGQWLMRAGDGVTERSNSAAPLGPSAGFTPVPLAEITAFYARHDLPVQLLLPERLGRAAERLLDETWELGPEILVMTRELDDAARTSSLTSALGTTSASGSALSFHIDDQPDDDWLALYHFRGQALPPEALEYLRKRIDGQMGFGRLVTREGQTVAITRGTLTDSGDGTTWLGYSAVEVDPAWRRRGLGTQLGIDMLRWGAENGADKAYLQVLASNAAGVGLYEKLGFTEHHRHRYAKRVV